jgi:hypothetical protein
LNYCISGFHCFNGERETGNGERYFRDRDIGKKAIPSTIQPEYSIIDPSTSGETMKRGACWSAIFIMALIVYAFSETVAPKLEGYFAYKTFKLDKQFSNVEGTISLFLDNKLITYKNPSLIYDPENPPPGDDPNAVLKNAMLCIVSEHGAITNQLLLEKPHASLSVDHLYGDSKKTYILEEDFSAPAGTYSGPCSMFVEVKNGKIVFLMAKDDENKGMKRISMGLSLKNQWKLVTARKGKGKDIIVAQYHPDWDAPAPKNKPMPFVTELTRYYYDGQKWVKVRKIISGGFDFETESSFPDLKLFP